VNVRGIAVGVALLSLASLMAPDASEARNPHCAGGIQYVVGGLRDKGSGNIEDYQRQMQKAISQLESCATEDTLDFEAIGYLGWAYAEVDSCGPAGRWFATAIAGLTAKGDKRKAEVASNNRVSYWTNKLNDGVNKISSAQSAYPDFMKKPENDADRTLKAEADKYYQQAIQSLTCASLMRPGNAQTLRNLGSVYLFMGDFPKAETVFREGLKSAPEDSALKAALKIARVNYANQLNLEKRYDEAIAYFGDLLKGDAENPDLHSSLANAHLSRAQTLQGDARKPEFKLAGVSYQRAGELRKDDPDLYFNAAVAYQNAGDEALAEGMWRASLKLRPGDIETLLGLSETLGELKKFPEAISTLHEALGVDPKDKRIHRRLGVIYSKAGNNPKGTEGLTNYLALDRGKLVPDVENYLAAQPRKGTDIEKTLTAMGPPEAIYLWPSDAANTATFKLETREATVGGRTVQVTQLPPTNAVESWFYWTKKQVFHFQVNVLSIKSDWGGSSGATGSRN